MTAGDEDLGVLRAKYHDWCSARVADRFLALSPDQIYSIAHGRSAGGPADAADGMPAPPAERNAEANGSASDGADASLFGDLSYPELVERVTLALAGQLGLPDFDAWVEEYRRDPGRYDAEIIGLWKEQEAE